MKGIIAYWHGYSDFFGVLEDNPSEAEITQALVELGMGRLQAVRYHKVSDNVASVSYSSAGRLLVSTQRVAGQSCLLILEDLPSHDYDNSIMASSKRSALRDMLARFSAARSCADVQLQLFSGVEGAVRPTSEITAPVRLVPYKDRWLELDDGQTEVAYKSGDTLVEGPMGAGKSLVLAAAMRTDVQRISEPHFYKKGAEKKLLFVTENPALAKETYQQFFAANGELFGRYKLVCDEVDQFEAVLYNTRVKLEFKSISALCPAGKRMVGLQAFRQWLGTKKNKPEQLEKESVEQLYRELQIRACAGSDYVGFGKKQSRYGGQLIKKMALNILYGKYIHCLGDDKVNMQLTPACTERYDIIYVDEFANNSALLNLRLAESCSRIHYYGDRVQSNDLLAHIQCRLLVDKFGQHAPDRALTCLPLSHNYRNSVPVVKLLNNLLRMYNVVCPGVNQYVQVPYQEGGRLKGECAILYGQPAAGHPLYDLSETVVLVPDQTETSVLNKIQDIYKYYPVIKVSDFQGLEAPTIILHGLFDDLEAMQQVNALLPALDSEMSAYRSKKTEEFMANEALAATISRQLVGVARGVQAVYVVAPTRLKRCDVVNAYILDACGDNVVTESISTPNPGQAEAFLQPIIVRLLKVGDFDQAKRLASSVGLEHLLEQRSPIKEAVVVDGGCEKPREQKPTGAQYIQCEGLAGRTRRAERAVPVLVIGGADSVVPTDDSVVTVKSKAPMQLVDNSDGGGGGGVAPVVVCKPTKIASAEEINAWKEKSLLALAKFCRPIKQRKKSKRQKEKLYQRSFNKLLDTLYLTALKSDQAEFNRYMISLMMSKYVGQNRELKSVKSFFSEKSKAILACVWWFKTYCQQKKTSRKPDGSFCLKLLLSYFLLLGSGKVLVIQRIKKFASFPPLYSLLGFKIAASVMSIILDNYVDDFKSIVTTDALLETVKQSDGQDTVICRFLPPANLEEGFMIKWLNKDSSHFMGTINSRLMSYPLTQSTGRSATVAYYMIAGKMGSELVDRWVKVSSKSFVSAVPANLMTQSIECTPPRPELTILFFLAETPIGINILKVLFVEQRPYFKELMQDNKVVGIFGATKTRVDSRSVMSNLLKKEGGISLLNAWMKKDFDSLRPVLDSVAFTISPYEVTRYKADGVLNRLLKNKARRDFVASYAERLGKYLEENDDQSCQELFDRFTKALVPYKAAQPSPSGGGMKPGVVKQ